MPPPGRFFELGWVMAQLFDPRRFQPLRNRAFNPELQLPMTADLDEASRRRVAAAEILELAARYPNLAQSSASVHASACVDPFDAAKLQEVIRSLHLEVLEEFAEDFQRLSSYHLGITLSDLCWNYTPEDGPDSFLNAFSRSALAELQVLLRMSGTQLPPLAAATVTKSLEKWQDWADVTAPMVRDRFHSLAHPILGALRDQGNIWRALLMTPPLEDEEDDEQRSDPAGTALLRRLRPILIAAALAAIVLYLTITNFSGAAKVWTTIGTISAMLGVTCANLLSAARKTVNAFGWNRQTTAKAEARVWSVTLLPAIALSRRQRSQLNRRSVRLSLRKNLDVY
jgi:hypothetical protein